MEEKVMKHLKLFSLLGLLAALAIPTFAVDNNAAAAFERLKKLAGTWEATTKDGKTARVTYEVIANGTAVVERDSGDGEHNGSAMETVYHLDGKDLVLEHFCMAGNQPKMRASGYNPQTGEVVFDFVSVGNLSSPAAGYMHNAKFRFVSNDQFAAEWTFFEDGKAKFTETIQSRRVQ
jgi:hypothetical protein